ncbi:ApeA N-terminal domain 1-containing protein [Streptomyces rimosus]|uniref:ApeA N-terminal domain 1-containing protein n=1 Tax=Streptomyces rimosus TaxID=1927 RepID=UPI00379F181E
MSNRTWRGYWWEPGTPDRKVPGTLSYDQSGQLRLELVGGFDITIRESLPHGNGYTVKAETRPVLLIHGTSGNEKFTLMDNSCTHTSGSGFFDGEITKQDWISIRALRGIHLASTETAIFIRSHLRLERLLHWANKSDFTLSIQEPEGDRPRPHRVERRPLVPTTAQHDDLSISLRLLSNDFRYDDDIVANERTLGGKERAVLTFTPPSPVPCKHFDEIEKDFQDLLTLCSYEPCGALNRSLVYETPDGHAKEVEVIGRQVYRTATEKRKADGHMLFSLADVDFSELAPKWLRLKSGARTGCNILFGLRYIAKGYVGTRLLGVATAAESLHAALRPKTTPIAKSEYRRLKKKLLAAIFDEPDNLIQFVNTGLHNNPTYNERMLELSSIPDRHAVDALLGSREQWSTMLRKSRNDLAHANERSSQEDRNSRAFLLLEVTYALLCLVLMSELGISSDAQRKAVKDHPRISYISREFKKELTSDKQ